MTAIDNLRTRRLQLEQDLGQTLSEERRGWIEGELIKIDIAVSFLDEVACQPFNQPTSKKAPL